MADINNAMTAHRKYEENLQLVNDICGHNSLEAVLSLFQVADLHSRQGLHSKVCIARALSSDTSAMLTPTCLRAWQALKLIHTACKTLHELGECPAEIVIGFYYLLGFVYERMSDYRRAIRAFETSLDFLERVYGACVSSCMHAVLLCVGMC
jgi:tetratricopeptide (TPR) repeat protein